MKITHAILVTLIVALTLSQLNGCDSNDPSNENDTNLSGQYFGETPPGSVPQMFAAEFFNDIGELHSPPVFSPDGSEVFFSPMDGAPSELMHMELLNGRWSQPEHASFNSSHGSGDPSFSPDGNKLFFMSWASQNTTYRSTKENIWVVDKIDGQWGTPVMLGNNVNFLDVHWQVSIASNGNLYFSGKEIGTEDEGIFCSEYVDGQYQQAELMSNAVNTQYYEGTPFIAPDESYLIFSRFGGNNPYTDLYICYKNTDGTWTEARNMGSTINTGGHELYAYVTADQQYLFFLSTRDGESKPYWISAHIIENLRQ